jgi:hypothetical protein
MPDYFLSAHGLLVDERKFIVPAGVTVYFFNPEGSKLQDGYSDVIMDILCCEDYHADLSKVHRLAVDVFRPLELCPDYETSEDPIEAGQPGGFRQTSGLYEVGRPVEQGPVYVLERSRPRRLSEWVRGIGGTNFYIGTCREHARGRGLPKIPFPRTNLFPELYQGVRAVPLKPKTGTYSGGIPAGLELRPGTLLTDGRLAALKRRLRRGQPLIPPRTT